MIILGQKAENCFNKSVCNDDTKTVSYNVCLLIEKTTLRDGNINDPDTNSGTDMCKGPTGG